MRFTKNKTVSLTDIPMIMKGSVPEKANVPILDHFQNGTSEEPIHNATGCKVQMDAVLLRTHPTNPFGLYANVGGKWYAMTRIHIQDPGIQHLIDQGHMLDFGPSPDQIEATKRREEERQRHDESSRAFSAKRALNFVARAARWEKRCKGIRT